MTENFAQNGQKMKKDDNLGLTFVQNHAIIESAAGKR